MKDFDYDDIEEIRVELEDEDGVTMEYEVNTIFEWMDNSYAVLVPVNGDEEEATIVGIELDLDKDEPEVTMYDIEDEDLMDALIDVYNENIAEDENETPWDSYAPSDDDDPDDDEEDGRWDEFINKKLD